MFAKLLRAGAAIALSVGVCLVTGCSSSKESAGQDKLTSSVGQYPPGPSGVNKPRVGVPPFDVTGAGGSNESNLDGLAADEMTTLLDQTGRFTVIERAQLKKLLDEQGLEGIVKSGELAKQGQVRGVDYLLIGKVTNLRVKQEKTGNNFGLAQIGGIINTGGADVKNSKTVITTDCGVDIRFVDPTNGQILTSNFSEYHKSDSAKSMGVSILGANAQSNADINLSQDDMGKILRLALDDALRKSLPKIDNFLRNQPRNTGANTGGAGNSTGSAAAGNPQNGAPANTANAAPANTGAPAGNTAVAGTKYCPECGTANPADAKFCSKCGHKF